MEFQLDRNRKIQKLAPTDKNRLNKQKMKYMTQFTDNPSKDKQNSDSSNLNRFVVPPTKKTFPNCDPPLIEHMSEITSHAIQSECEFFLGDSISKRSEDIYHNHLYELLFGVYFKHELSISMDSILLTIFIFFKHNSGMAWEGNPMAYELLIAYLLISIKIVEMYPPSLEEILSFVYYMRNGKPMNIMRETLENIKNVIFLKEAMILEGIHFKIRQPPFFFFLDCLIESEKLPARKEAKYDWLFFNIHLKNPQLLFCRKDGFRYSALEIVEALKEDRRFNKFC